MDNKVRRWFLRCRGCLSVMAIEAERPASGMRCSACEGGIEIMGAVRQQRLIRLEERCPCDLRCTMAAGPECNCLCGGMNHGSQIMVTMAVNVGGIPRITPVNPEKARRVHGEWLQAKKGAEDRIVKHFPTCRAVAQGMGQDLSAWDRAQGARGMRYLDLVSRAGALKTHHGRIKAIADLDKKLTEAAR